MWGQRLPPEACLDPREACTFAYTQIGHENSKESRCVDLPSFGRLPVVWAVGARVHGVFTGEGCHAQCLAVLSVFMFLGCCFFLFGLICSDFLIHCVFWSCSSFPFLFVIAVFESCRRRCFSHQNYADPMPVRSRVISVRQPLVPRALQRVCPTAFKGRLKSQLIHTTHFPH